MVIEQSQQGARIGLMRGNSGLNLVHSHPEPVLRIAEVYAFHPNSSTACNFPLYGVSVQAGFPSPADDYIERYLDLNSDSLNTRQPPFCLKP